MTTRQRRRHARARRASRRFRAVVPYTLLGYKVVYVLPERAKVVRRKFIPPIVRLNLVNFGKPSQE